MTSLANPNYYKTSTFLVVLSFIASTELQRRAILFAASSSASDQPTKGACHYPIMQLLVFAAEIHSAACHIDD